jgi:hypothetical protein
MKLQNVVTIGALLGSGYYSYAKHKGLAMGSVIVILSTVVGFVVGGYMDTVLGSTKK